MIARAAPGPFGPSCRRRTRTQRLSESKPGRRLGLREGSRTFCPFCAFPNSDDGEGSSPFGQIGLVLALAFSFAAAAAGSLPPVADYGWIVPPSPSQRSRDSAGLTHDSHPTQTSGPADHNLFAYQQPTAPASILVAGTGTPVKGGGAAAAEVDPPICHNQLRNVVLVVAPSRPSLPATTSYQDGCLAPVPADACDLGVSDSAQSDDDGPTASASRAPSTPLGCAGVGPVTSPAYRD